MTLLEIILAATTAANAGDEMAFGDLMASVEMLMICDLERQHMTEIFENLVELMDNAA